MTRVPWRKVTPPPCVETEHLLFMGWDLRSCVQATEVAPRLALCVETAHLGEVVPGPAHDPRKDSQRQEPRAREGVLVAQQGRNESRPAQCALWLSVTLRITQEVVITGLSSCSWLLPLFCVEASLQFASGIPPAMHWGAASKGQ